MTTKVSKSTAALYVAAPALDTTGVSAEEHIIVRMSRPLERLFRSLRANERREYKFQQGGQAQKYFISGGEAQSLSSAGTLPP